MPNYSPCARDSGARLVNARSLRRWASARIAWGRLASRHPPMRGGVRYRGTEDASVHAAIPRHTVSTDPRLAEGPVLRNARRTRMLPLSMARSEERVGTAPCSRACDCIARSTDAVARPRHTRGQVTTAPMGGHVTCRPAAAAKRSHARFCSPRIQGSTRDSSAGGAGGSNGATGGPYAGARAIALTKIERRDPP